MLLWWRLLQNTGNSLYFPCITGNLGSRDEFARDCLLQRRVSNELYRGGLTREPDRLVHGSSNCGVEGQAPRYARRPAALLGVGNHHGADAAGGFPPGTYARPK